MERNRESATDRLARLIGVAIITAVYAPSQTLPNEFELAEANGMSRNAVREALRTLGAKGLIESRRKAGTWVRSRSSWNLLDSELLRWMFEKEPPRSFVQSLFELRMIVEPAAAALAAQRRAAVHVSEMRTALDTMRVCGLGSLQGQAADQHFHATLLAAAGNELLESLSAGIGSAVQWTTDFKFRTQANPRNPMAEHDELLDAIADRDEHAARRAAERLIGLALTDTELSLRS